jgi:hypothetical protein
MQPTPLDSPSLPLEQTTMTGPKQYPIDASDMSSQSQEIKLAHHHGKPNYHLQDSTNTAKKGGRMKPDGDR